MSTEPVRHHDVSPCISLAALHLFQPLFQAETEGTSHSPAQPPATPKKVNQNEAQHDDECEALQPEVEQFQIEEVSGDLSQQEGIWAPT